MRRILEFLIFITIFLSWSFLLNYYIFFHVSFMFKLPRDLWFWLFYLFSSSIFVFIFGLGQRFDSKPARGLYIFFSVWLGYLFILLFILFGYDLLRHLIKIDPFTVGPILIGIVTIATMLGLFNGRFLRTHEVIIPVSIGKVSNNPNKNTKLVQISDVHLGPVHGKEFLEKLVKKTNSLNPDYVLITGDLVDGPGNFSADYFAPLNKIKAPVFFTTGNHDYYAGVERVIELLGKTKVRVLKNEKIELGNIELIGINNSWNKKEIIQLVTNLKPNRDKFTILMNHQPTGFKEVQPLGVDLMLSGHTHGGQFFPFTFLARLLWWGRKGLKKFKNAYMYVTNGTGTWGPPLRLGTSSEIALIRLVAKNN